MIPINIEGGMSKQEKRIYNRDINKRRGSGVGPKPLVKKNSRPRLKTFQVEIKLDDDPVGDLTKPQFVKRRSVQKIQLPTPNDRKKGHILPVEMRQERRQSSSHDLLGLSQRRRSCGKTRTINRRDSRTTLNRLERCQDSLSNISLGENSENFTQFQITALAAHNKYRNIHGVQQLQLDVKLCKLAQCYAEQLANTNKFEHSGDCMYGENLYWGWSSDPKWQLPGEEAVDSWYDEKKGYDYSRDPTDLESGHFTQLVWSASRRLGVGVAKSSKTGRYMVVMKYDPAGNYLGQYTDNVTPPADGGGKLQI